MNIRTAAFSALATIVVVAVPVAAHATPNADSVRTPGGLNTYTALQPPSAPVASDITPTSATLSWTSGGGPVRRLRVFQLVAGTWHSVGPLLGPAETSLPLTDLTAETTYTFAVQAFATPGSGYSDSPLSEPGTFTTPPVGMD